jgi:hypothetical protein
VSRKVRLYSGVTRAEKVLKANREAETRWAECVLGEKLAAIYDVVDWKLELCVDAVV